MANCIAHQLTLMLGVQGSWRKKISKFYHKENKQKDKEHNFMIDTPVGTKRRVLTTAITATPGVFSVDHPNRKNRKCHVVVAWRSPHRLKNWSSCFTVDGPIWGLGRFRKWGLIRGRKSLEAGFESLTPCVVSRSFSPLPACGSRLLKLVTTDTMPAACWRSPLTWQTSIPRELFYVL